MGQKPTPLDRDGVGIAFWILRGFDFSPTQQAAVFGKTIRRRKHLRGVKVALGREMTKVDRLRVLLILDIGVWLNTAFSSNAEIKGWLKQSQQELDNKSPQELLLTGEPENFTMVLWLAMRIAG